MERCAVIVPAHNEGRFLAEMLESVRRFGPPDADIIVVDNGSTDSTAEIARSFGARLIISPTNLFPGAARNLGVRSAAAELLVFLDGDVVLTPEWRAQWDRLIPTIHTDYAITGATYQVSRQPAWIETSWFRPMCERERGYINGGNLITTVACFNAIGGFNERLETGEDVDFCSRAIRAGINVMLAPGFKAHHEGYPRTFSAFIKRERWHGRGDLASLKRALTSKVVLASAAFMALHLAALTLIVLAIHDRDWLAPAVAFGAILILCAASVKRAVNPSLGSLPQTLPIMYAYYLGRSLATLDVLRGAKSRRHR